jgi:SAM-dependent methyltransferase
MLARAEERAREQGLTNTAFERADAQLHDFGRDVFDVALSRFGAMFFDDHAAALRNIGSAIRPGGRIVLMSWLPFENNVWIQRIRDAFAAGRNLPGEPSGRPGPFGLAEPAYIRALLLDAQFTDIRIEEIREPMWFGRTADDALAFWKSSGMNRGLLGDAEPALRERAYASLRSLFQECETAGGVLLDSAAWLTTARKVRATP